MVEEQVEIVILVINSDPFLSRDEGEVGDEFQYEALEFSDDRGFNVLLCVFTVEAEEVEEIRVAEDQVRRKAVPQFQRCQLLFDDFLGLLADGGAFKEHGANSAPKRAN